MFQCLLTEKTTLHPAKSCEGPIEQVTLVLKRTELFLESMKERVTLNSGGLTSVKEAI